MKVPTYRLVAVLALVILIPALALPPVQAQPRPRRKPGRVWVRFKADGPAALRQRAAALGVGEVDTELAELNAAVLAVPVGQEDNTAARLAARPDVALAEPIPEAHILAAPNDPMFTQQWSLTTIGAPSAWDVVKANSNILIAIVDTGVDLSHSDLAGQIWTNPGEIPGNGIDDDHNGKVDDVHGWHFYTVSSGGQYTSLEDANVQDDHGHGSHVAGIAGAATNNGRGVAAVSWGARVMPVKVLGADGNGWYDDIIRGIIYAADNGARIINLSVGGEDPFTPLQQAIAYAQARGVLTVAATGNTNQAVLYPAAYPEAMAVAATDSSDTRASFSNYGEAVSVAAPGVGIESTWRGGTYATMTGTSMATPHVAGLAALIWTLHPEYRPWQVRRTIELTARDTNAASLAGRDPELGWGRIDAARAVRQQMYWYHVPSASS